MRFLLKEFQDIAAIQLLQRLNLARRELAEGGGPQTIVFSAPTASGKTVMLAAMLEAVLVDNDLASKANVDPQPDSSILWLSDSPNLNIQSRQRLLEASDGLIPGSLVVVENDFDQSVFYEGKVYFLNYGKLSVNALLTRPGNTRSWTIWETIAQTARARPNKFVVVIDEAHYGLQRNQEERNLAATIPQRFLVGAPGLVRPLEGRAGMLPLPPMPLIIGVSATPQRLAHFLQGQAAARTNRGLDVEPAAVRVSGLIKDRIVLHSSEAGGNEWTMLREACQKLLEVERLWGDYAVRTADPAVVIPALIVQVNNAVSAAFVADVVTRICGPDALPALQEDQIVHCFGEGGDIRLGDRIVRRADPNEISGDARIRVVLFKTALNTGWDCPRAEVLMSFRNAEDPTNIAQLVGRMVRTPLAERVIGIESLNEVYLYLPNYNRAAVRRVIDHLTAERDGGGAEAVRAEDIVTLIARGGSEEILDAIRQLPSEAVPPNRPMPEIRRLLKMSRVLERHGIAEDQEGPEIQALFDRASQWLEDRRREVHDIDGRIAGMGAVSFDETAFGDADGDGQHRGNYVVQASEADVYRRYRAAALRLAPEIGNFWLDRRHRPDDPRWAMLEFIWLAQSQALRQMLDREAQVRFGQLRARYDAAIRRLPPHEAQVYRDLQRVGREVQRVMLIPEQRVVFPLTEEAVQVGQHLYVEEGTEDTFRTHLRGWEARVIAAARARPDFVAWLRNLDRKPWSLSYSYPAGGTAKPGFPDFLVFRREADGSLVTDILEPHRIQEDSVVKAKGMARFADDYGENFGRINMILVDGDTIIHLPFKDFRVRQEILENVHTHEHLNACFRAEYAERELVPAG